ncbi:MAG: hypothetical protein GX357_02910 [Firmicutes bacterium]|nr:hypothetical protein [Bacillota bacterium]
MFGKKAKNIRLLLDDFAKTMARHCPDFDCKSWFHALIKNYLSLKERQHALAALGL